MAAIPRTALVQTRIQNNVLDIMNLMVREIRRMNRFVDLTVT